MMPNEIWYTQEQLDIALLNQKNDGFNQTLVRLEQKVDSHFHWTLGLIFGVYAMALTGLVGALGHSYGWF